MWSLGFLYSTHKGPHNQNPTGLERDGAGRSGPFRPAPRRSDPPGAESAWSQLFLVGVRPFVSESAWSQLFQVGVSHPGRSWAGLAGVRLESAVSGRSKVGVSCFRSESGWSQPFPTGVSLESAACGSGHNTTQHGNAPPPPAHQHPTHGSGGAAPPPHQHPNTPEQHRPAKSPNPPRRPPHKKKARVTNTAPWVCGALLLVGGNCY